MRNTDDTNPPPRRPAGAGREYYLPEYHYFHDTKEVTFLTALRITSKCVVEWCDTYKATIPDQFDGTVLVRPGDNRKGTFPPDPPGRRALLDDIFDWSERLGRPGSLRLYLRTGNDPVLQEDEFLLLSPQQFATLQACWLAHNLPLDLYYLASAQHEVDQADKTDVGRMGIRQLYTPKRWALRFTLTNPLTVAPTEERSDHDFLATIERFRTTLLSRAVNLREAGKAFDRREALTLTGLLAHVNQYMAERYPTPSNLVLRQGRRQLLELLHQIYGDDELSTTHGEK